ncbi:MULTISPECIES: cell wall metabolism sensor histidine kinase WalK [unclassified Bacillus (in: firmicutes)]|uniref:cell wall metabolism sensor histidine kinase WalK n=1 Tax=unclassified Bacillus (in: firmicutes) TaxID=185979 RepID=UPI001BE8AF89|nr:MULTISPECIES: cell wall metabolism sensor histidine kinase WalK [unclassified Bacillus (in: firmicutes)]MBT2638725.1 cell wall metabolism sensor histidine kinase WalK [Bacillus sp. ISL-39]MBT2663710.1 cell wall metabolism sensor histidine kinase WalK [Bacillus sp. ISL-45]
MKKVGFFRSIHLKFVIIYVLLILVAMQIIGVYFVRKLETTLMTNYQESIKSRVDLLVYDIQEELVKERGKEDPTKEEAIREILRDYKANDISEIRVIDGSSFKILGTSSLSNQGMVGQRTPDVKIKRSIIFEEDEDGIQLKDNDRVWVLSTPIMHNSEAIGAVYLVAQIDHIFKQMNDINKILATGTAIALIFTAILGVLLAQTITRPISDMRKQALAMTRGNFSRKVKVYGYDEIGQLAITFNNLTKKLQEAQATTEGEKRKLSSVISYMTDGVISTDRKGRIILINDPAAQMLGVPRETILSQPLVSVLGLDENYTFEDLLQEKESIVLDYSTKSKPFILRANFSVIQKESGFVNGLIAVLYDITEQEKIDMERREFVANVSHELRTPLTTMRSYLEALAEGAWRDEEIAPNFLETTRGETERMIRLVNDLLQLSKLDSVDYRLSKEWVNFPVFFNRIIDRFEMTKEQNVSFKREITEDAIFVEIDEDKITQVLDNIISNAMKYSPEGGTITFRVKELDDQIVASISDEGVGIPKDNLDKIFDRFYRVDKARTRKLGGTGLGLAIAKEMVNAHGGRIWAESVEGKGTTVQFTLPYDRSAEDDWS